MTPMAAIGNDEKNPLRERLDLRQNDAMRRYAERKEQREKIQQAVEKGGPLTADTAERVAAKRAIVRNDTLALERILGTSDLFPVSYLEAGQIASKSVCRIEISDRLGHVRGYGTGFMISPSLLMTNNHVFESLDDARFSTAEFNYEKGLDLLTKPSRVFRFEPVTFFLTDVDLDVSIVAVNPVSTDNTPLCEYGFLPLIAESGKALVGEYVSIIQHPSGAPKMIAIRENEILDVFDHFLHYKTDTEPGSSGSPVLSDGWDVVALHHAGVPNPDGSGSWVANEGIRISSIVAFIRSQYESMSSGEKRLIEEMLGVRIPGVAPADTPFPDTPHIDLKEIVAEELAPEWYEDVTRYDENFLKVPVPVPTFSCGRESDIAPLKNGGTTLDYTHFSVVMSKSRKLAFYTVVNIDGKNLVSQRRSKDSWYFDSRMDTQYQSGPDLYSRNPLDRGHLVRRLDPVWGSDAKKANEDTFHFTNCSPQHKNLNQKTWLDLETYILNNAKAQDLKVTVFTGPVFRDDDMVYRGSYQIPAEFWKIVAMVKEDGTLSATAYLQTQKNMISGLEFAYGEYKTYQVPVSKIEGLTGLNFGKLRDHDPAIRMEALTPFRMIEQMEDIRV